MPNPTIKNRVETLLPRLKRRDPSLSKGSEGLLLYFVLMVTALTAGGGFSLLKNMRHVLDGFMNREIREFKFNVFLSDHADRSFLEEHFLSWPGIRSARFVTREEALGRAHDDPALVQSIKLAVRNPLPESFEMVWDPAFLTPDLLVPAAEKWALLEGVRRIGYDLSRLERLALLSRLSRETDVFFSVILWGTLVATVIGLGGLFFDLSVPLRVGPLLGGVAMGTLGGAGGAVTVLAWIGAWEPVGILAGALVGLLGGIFHGRVKG